MVTQATDKNSRLSTKPLQFLTFLIFTSVVILALFSQNPIFLFSVHLFVFLLVPVIDFVVGENKFNPEDPEIKTWSQSRVWAPLLYIYVLSHFLVLYMAIQKLPSLSMPESLLLASAVGLYTGGLGITVAHELCHKKDKLHRYMADILLASVCYTHFAIEHVRGHHFHVATQDDPASARFGESVYAFLPRTLKDSFLSAWGIDSKKVLLGISLTLLFILIILVMSGIQGLVFFFTQSIVAIILLELVNYVEHYGLSRKALPNGRHEVVRPQHSWNSSHVFSNLLLFNLQRHSDHHAAANLPFTILKHHDKAPQLPSGYPGMILLSLVPPLWFKLMNAKLQDIQKLST